MIVHPLPYRRNVGRIPLATMDSAGTVDGSLGGICFADSPQPLLRLARRRGGTATMLRGRGSTRWLRFQIGGTTYIPGTPNPSLEEVRALESFAAGHGVEMSSLPKVAFNLFRSTLPGYQEIALGATMPRDKFPPGARLHARPGVYDDAVSLDVCAAYLWGIGTLRIPVVYSTGRARLSEIIESPGSFALARIRLRRESMYGAVPCFSNEGTTAYPTRREGYSDLVLLSSDDLRLAAVMGDVRIEKSWTGTRYVSPFTAFYSLANEMREECGAIGKQTANTLWGVFSTGAQVSTVTFIPGERRHKIQRMPLRDPLCFPVAAIVLSRIRSKVYGAMGENTVHVHTDGIITTGSVAHIPIGDTPGEWRIVGRYPRVEVLAPGWYRYVTTSGEERIKAAGRDPANDASTRRIFNHRRKTWLEPFSGAVLGGTELPSIRRVDTGTV
jgi:hypothetical protein